MTAHVALVRRHEEAVLPTKGSKRAAGYDLTSVEGVTIPAGERKLIPTGWSIQISPGYEGQVRARSGLALKNGLTVLNSPGTIDEDYRGPLGVLLINHGHTPVHLPAGSRIAQLVISAVPDVQMHEVDYLDDSPRGCNGFGSTGV
jgi:dUTP pyrophosphatase